MSAVLKTTARLTGPDVEFVACLRMDTDEAEALRELTGLQDPQHAPLATLVHALVEAGIGNVKSKAEEVAYARLGNHLKNDQEHKAWRRSRRARNGRPFASEAA